MQDAISFVNIAAIAVVMSIIGYRFLLFWSDQFGYAENRHMKVRLQYLGFVYHMFTKPAVAASSVLVLALLNSLAYALD